MRRLLIITAVMAALLTTSCQRKTATATPANADSTEVEADTVIDDSIHTEAYIRQRVKHIYDLVLEGYGRNTVSQNSQVNTEQFTSAEYNNLRREAQRLAPEETPLDVPGADYDHWVMGQDIDDKVSMEVISVSDIRATTAKAKIRVVNFRPTEVTLPLVLENGDWLIDSFITTFEVEGESTVFDEKKELKSYIEKMRK